jgi:hypothetical protein
MKFIRFEHIPDEKDVTLKEQIKNERDGIFGVDGRLSAAAFARSVWHCQ